MISKELLHQNGYKLIDDYFYDDIHHSLILEKGDICLIVDDDICNNRDKVFDYSKYCEMQNKYMFLYNKLYRINITDCDDIILNLQNWVKKNINDIQIEDNGGSFALSHIDNTPLEKHFEDLFSEAYGNDSIKYLHKEYPISLNAGKNGFVDYVIETNNGNYAIEENGVSYHHPCLITAKQYNQQLEKQNTLSLLGFKIYRFSSENIKFKDQTIDSLKKYLGSKDNFKANNIFNENREFKLYKHQENALKEIEEKRKQGLKAALIVLPTGTGKSLIGIKDINELFFNDLIKNILIMVPSLRIKNDWMNRLKDTPYVNNVQIKMYNEVFKERNVKPADYYDYIIFDEAHHAQAANCKKTLQYFNPKFLLGLTATPERLDQKKLEEIFGTYESNLTLLEAIQRNIISNIRCYRLLSNIDLSNVRYNGKDYNEADLEETLIIDSRNELIVNTIKKYFEPRKNFYKQGIIFCVNINHAIKLESMLNSAGIKSKAVYGSNTENDQIFEDYKNKKVQFLLSCQLISEGWDSPQTEIVVMARPTLSKVLYLQQIGRGTRKYPGKECLYVIDVVDNYESKLKPWNFNSLFHISNYSDFNGVINNENHEYLEILGLSEQEISMQEIDIFTFEEKYHDYLSLEQAARELFIGTETLRMWLRKNPTYSSFSLPIGNKMMPYFSPENIATIRKDKKITIHNDETIVQDFIEFIDENTLTFSFKLILILNMFKLCDKDGEVNLDTLTDEYTKFYRNRLEHNLPVDKSTCVYTMDYLNNKTSMKRSLLENPFEKFERKRFMYLSKDLNIVCFNPALWDNLTKEDKNNIIEKENKFLEEYYSKYGGLVKDE